ncbi:CPBP family intramembrane glutamic endopeptidase [Piscicoccus intestinalis]|uniref:CPBP family intramembrane glutamic endopeptidase n=1 Tax=Piscicoccus intestinalis TaxID=746033 RepID=UPI000837DA8D|nr:CPBP family intramembrane glutamic endopeptidase [Piscicoccus intestinalis]
MDSDDRRPERPDPADVPPAPPPPPTAAAPDTNGAGAAMAPRPTGTETRAPRLIPTATAAELGWAVLAMVLAGVGGVAVVFGVLRITDTSWWTLLMLPGSALTAAAVLWWPLRHRRRWTWADVGFVRMHRPAHLLWEIPLTFLVGLLGAAGLGTLLGVVPDEAQANQASTVSDALDAPLWLGALTVACLVVIWPLLEEIIFRRILLGALSAWLPIGLAVVLAAVIFAAVHVLLPAMLYVIGLGLGACLLYLRHRSLWAPLILHMINNAIATSVTFALLTQ